MSQLQEKTIGEYVAENFRTAAVFKKYGINFCCKGGRTIEETCKMKDLDPAPIYEDLKNTPQGAAEENDFNNKFFLTFPMPCISSRLDLYIFLFFVAL